MNQELEESIRQYLRSARIGQLATAKNNIPWVCSIYIVWDEELNLYWLSYPERRHSRELTENDTVSMAIAIKLDQPVIGLQIEGTVSLVQDSSIVKSIMKQYVAVHDGAGKDFYEKFMRQENRHQLYRLTPSKINLFDEVNFPSGQAKIWKRI